MVYPEHAEEGGGDVLRVGAVMNEESPGNVMKTTDRGRDQEKVLGKGGKTSC